MSTTLAHSAWRSNGQTRRLPMPPVVRDRIGLNARDVMRAVLRRQELTCVNSRAREELMEHGKPLAVLGMIVAEVPEAAAVFSVWLHGMAVEPASLNDCITLLVAADANEEVAKAEALRNPTPANLRKWARALELQAARSTETARALQDAADEKERAS